MTTVTVTATDPPPGDYPSLHSRLVFQEKNKKKWSKHSKKDVLSFAILTLCSLTEETHDISTQGHHNNTFFCLHILVTILAKGVAIV